ncbi:hypothetical protein K0U27_08510 [archaeon]|nr:hypothetical protein [archaeon]
MSAIKDFTAPSIYTFYDEPEFRGKQVNAREKWITCAEHSISEAKQYGKPVHVYVGENFIPQIKYLEKNQHLKNLWEFNIKQGSTGYRKCNNV